MLTLYFCFRGNSNKIYYLHTETLNYSLSFSVIQSLISYSTIKSTRKANVSTHMSQKSTSQSLQFVPFEA